MPETPITPDDPLAVDVDNDGTVEPDVSNGSDTPSPPNWIPAEPGEILSEPFAGNLILNPCCPVTTRAFTGYAGPSECSGNWRLYSNLEFSDYIEFRRLDVIHNTKYVEYQGTVIGNTGWAPITRTIVWLGVGSRITYGRVRSHTVESAFLSGVVTNESDLDQFAVQSDNQSATGPGYSPPGDFRSRGPC